MSAFVDGTQYKIKSNKTGITKDILSHSGQRMNHFLCATDAHLVARDLFSDGAYTETGKPETQKPQNNFDDLMPKAFSLSSQLYWCSYRSCSQQYCG